MKNMILFYKSQENLSHLSTNAINYIGIFKII